MLFFVRPNVFPTCIDYILIRDTLFAQLILHGADRVQRNIPATGIMVILCNRTPVSFNPVVVTLIFWQNAVSHGSGTVDDKDHLGGLGHNDLIRLGGQGHIVGPVLIIYRGLGQRNLRILF